MNKSSIQRPNIRKIDSRKLAMIFYFEGQPKGEPGRFSYEEGVWVPLTPPISSPKNFVKKSFGKSLSKIINLCTPPPFGGDDLMRIPA